MRLLLFWALLGNAQAELIPFSFQGSFVSGFQSGGGENYSGQVSWNPLYSFDDDQTLAPDMAFKGNFAAGLFKSRSTDGTFLSTTIELLLYKALGQFAIEGGGGIQIWGEENGGTQTIFSGNLSYELPALLPLPGTHRVLVGYSLFQLTGEPVHFLRAGLALLF